LNWLWAWVIGEGVVIAFLCAWCSAIDRSAWQLIQPLQKRIDKLEDELRDKAINRHFPS